MIPLFAVHMPTTVDKPLLDVLHSGYIGQGKKVEEFEKALGQYIGNENVLTVNSATSGLELALVLSGVNFGDEVITSPMTCMATNTPIISRGAIPVWADVDPDTGLIDPLDVERKITKKTKAIIAVHWGGLPCDLLALAGVATAYGLPLIEDAAHAFGSRYGHRRLGDQTLQMQQVPHFTVYSFQAIKHITTGDGGAVFCSRSEDYKRGKLLRWYGIDREVERKDMRCEEDVIESGWKWHMNDINATIGIVQLNYIDGVLKAQRENALYYYEHLRGPSPAFPKESLQSTYMQSSFWLYTILCNDESERNEFMGFMNKKGVMVSKVHTRHDTHTAFAPFRKSPLPGVDSFSDRHISIPVHWALTTRERDHIVDSVNSFYESRQRIEKDA
jgi:perosamine synthetase